jgi:hypothetical protein
MAASPAFVGPAVGQPSFPGAPDDRGVNLRVYPADVWSPRVGAGAGLGLVGHNLVRRHDQWLLTAAPALHEQVATAAFASANPRRARRYVLVDTRALHTDRDWLGPAGRRTVFERSALQARLRGGQWVFNHRLLLQPYLAGSHHVVDAVNRPPTGSVPDAGLFPKAEEQQTGLRAGIDVRYDTRNRRLPATRGVLLQGSWARYVSLDATDLQFDQVDLDAHGYVPIGGLHRLALRASLTLTRSRADAPVPSYLLPTLGASVVPGWARGRFVGPDRLITTLLYRFPILHVEDLVSIEGHVGGHLASTYDNVFQDFATTVSFDDDQTLGKTTQPLRPAASAGLRFAIPSRPHATLELGVGVSPEGTSAARISVVRPLLSLRPPHHTSQPVW